MRIRTDDEVYRVDAVWLGPPKATFPWRARYVVWDVGTVVFLVVLTVFRQVGINLFWSIGRRSMVTIGGAADRSRCKPPVISTGGSTSVAPRVRTGRRELA